MKFCLTTLFILFSPQAAHKNVCQFPKQTMVQYHISQIYSTVKSAMEKNQIYSGNSLNFTVPPQTLLTI